jgi:serine/threonine protein kinase
VKDLITKLLEKDPKKRLSAKEAMDHPWIHESLSTYNLKNKTSK